MSDALLAQALSEDLALHWRDVLEEQGIATRLETSSDGGSVDIFVSESQLAQASKLFADPFAEESGELEPTEAEAAAEQPITLAPDERTEVLARTPDLPAAQRLVSLLRGEGLYADVSWAASSNTFGADGLPSATITIAEKQRESAFVLLQEVARANPELFEGAANISPSEVVEAMLLAPFGLLKVRARSK